MVLSPRIWGRDKPRKISSYKAYREGGQIEEYRARHKIVFETKRGLERNLREKKQIEMLVLENPKLDICSISQLHAIKMKTNENYYPPESAIRPEYIEKIKKIRTHTMQNRGEIYNSMDEFFDSL